MPIPAPAAPPGYAWHVVPAGGATDDDREDGSHPPDQQYDSVAAAETLQQLVALGYISPPRELERHDVRALEFARRARRADPESWEALALEAPIHHGAGRHEDAVSLAIVPKARGKVVKVVAQLRR